MEQILDLHAAGQVITATGSSVATQFTAGVQANMASTSSKLTVSNPGPVGVYVSSGVFADTPVVTSANNYVPPGTLRTFKRAASHDCVALLSAGANQAVTIIHGAGA